MKKNRIYSFVAVLCMVTSLISCKKYLDRTPLSDITSDAFFSNATEVQQALVGVYSAAGARTISPGFSNPTPYYAKMDLYTEIGLERGLNGTIGSGAYNTTNGTVAELWAGFYQVIQRANSLLFLMTKAQPTMDPASYNRVVAEAKTLRAFAYWHLIVYFGDVPLFTGPLKNEDIYGAKRTPRKDIIDFLVADVQAIAPNLDWNFTEAGRVNRGTALGIAARLAMIDKRYSVVTTLTEQIISGGGNYGLNPVYENLFRKAGQATNAGNEIMFIYTFGDADAGSFNYLNLVQGSRNQGGQSSHFPSQFLVDLYECRDGLNIINSPLYNPAKPNANRDPRMRQSVIVPGDTVIVQGSTNMIFNFTDRTIFTYNTATQAIAISATANQDSGNIFGPRQNGMGTLWRKYTNDRDINGTAGNAFKVGWVFMRFAEILLLNAEAKFESNGNIAEVVATLNRVRRRAGHIDVPAAVAANTTQLRQLIRREKTVEFANEGIHMADLRRWDDGAYAAKVMPVQMYGQSLSRMQIVPGVGVTFINPAPNPTFDATYNVPISYPNGDATRLKRELRLFNVGQHILCPVPQGELDKVPALTQNAGW